MSNNAESTTTTESSDKVVARDFGEGRYSPLMKEAFKDAIRLTTMTPDAAEKFARNLGADLGRAMHNSPAAVKYGKANKDGRMSLKEAASLKGVISTKALSIARLLSLANDLRKETQNTGLGEAEVSFDLSYE